MQIGLPILIFYHRVSKTEKWKEVITENRSIRQSVLEERKEHDRKLELERIKEEAAQRKEEQERKVRHLFTF